MKQFLYQLFVHSKRLAIIFLTGMLVIGAPAPYVLADDAATDATSAASTCSPVATPPAGTQSPTGADATTYTYNSCTGLWENQYYTWNPVTKTTTPKTPYVYACDATTWNWTYKEWVYSPSRGKFHQVTEVVGQLPAGALIAADSVTPCAPAAITGTGPGSTNTSSTSSNNSAVLSTTTNTSMNNQVNSSAQSGSAVITNNTTGGNATTGNAEAIATVVNALQSSTSLTSAPVATFTANIDGNVQGDLVIDPTQLQPAVNSSTLTPTDLSLTSQNTGQINNNITLTAKSGDAAVTHNTSAGNATSGSAEAIANVVNLLNSYVSAGQSFIGVVNINGNLDGNILMPQSFLDSLIASNAPTSTVTLNAGEAQKLGIASTNSLATTNNVTSSAITGQASVSGNTSAGNATSGSASTTIRVFNLTGSQVIGANCLLVFVNVSGTWVGVIMNAPAGATAAAYGGGLSSNMTLPSSITSENSSAITNNINVNAASGNASVTNNTSGGSATSGDAHTAVNLLNMNADDMVLSGWFGILFINVFGNWYGNFGVYTPPASARDTSRTPLPGTHPFHFVPKSAGKVAGASTGPSDPPLLQDASAHLAGVTNGILRGAGTVKKPERPADYTTLIVGGALIALGALTFVSERIMARPRSHRSF